MLKGSMQFFILRLVAFTAVLIPAPAYADEACSVLLKRDLAYSALNVDDGGESGEQGVAFATRARQHRLLLPFDNKDVSRAERCIRAMAMQCEQLSN